MEFKLKKNKRRMIIMVQEKVMYEVNGKLFDNKSDAEKEELKSGVKYKEIADKYHSILCKVSLIAEYTGNNDLCSIVIEVNDKEISPEWYVTKSYHSVFIRILKELNVKYLASDGDERLSAYFKIYPTKIDDIPSHSELAERVPLIIEEIEREQKAYLDRVMGR